MLRLLQVLLAGLVAVTYAAVHAAAIEPDAPTHLLTQEEALAVAVRRRLDQLSVDVHNGEDADRAALAAYYADLNGPLLWVDESGLKASVAKIVAEFKNAEQWGLNPDDFDIGDIAQPAAANADLVTAEMQIGLAVLKYARHARGGRMDPKQLSLDIDRTPPLEDPRVVLDTVRNADDPAAYLRGLHPTHEQFGKLRLAYLKALEQERNGIQPEAAAAVDRNNKARRKTRRGKPRTKLSKRLLYNMEMWRWMPRDLGQKFVWANIPEFLVRVVKAGQVVHRERIVTGKVANKTPIFSDEMESVVFHPFWGVPNSIKVKEILPSLVRGGNILEKQNLKISYGGRPVDPYSIDWSRQDIRNFHVFQPPGRRNALGVVKFLFPNKHAVYMHDTPSKHLFKRTVRAYSHGCVRVRDPLRLAEVLLGHDKGWGRSKIDALVRSGPKNNQISLDRKIPVHVTYFTARINAAGKPVLVKDIYGHERRIQMGFDGKAHLIVKRKVNLDAARKKVVDSISPYANRSRDDSWMRQILGN